jgi:hypothetical protein
MCLSQWNLLARWKGISITLWRACGADWIQNKRPFVYMTHLFYHCIQLWHWKESKTIKIPKRSWAPRFLKIYLLLASYSIRPANRQSTEKHNTHQLLYIYSIPPDDGLQVCPKHEEVDWRNKLRINCASSWFLLHRCIEMDRQKKTIKIHFVWRNL